jgi:fumarylacetoacetase
VTGLDATHDPALTSWVASANEAGTDFPIQNLPYGRFRRAGTEDPLRVGVAIGSQVLDLRLAAELCPWGDGIEELLQPLAAGDLAGFMNLDPPAWRAVRAALSLALATGSDQGPFLETCLLPRAQAAMQLPCAVGDYTDFYTSLHHAMAVGRLFRPDNPLLPNYKWVPIGYHGRSSSIGVSGQRFPRPWGQTKGEGDAPLFAPSRRLDYELELGLFVGPPNAPGMPLDMAQAEASLFGATLLNDWSARDVQAWEYQPLGPFLAKNFATTISPWIVTMEALAPFRAPFVRDAADPQPLPYLDSADNRERGGIAIALEVWLQTSAMRARGESAVRVSASSFADAYWTPAQLLAHHASNGCNLQAGDLMGSGTQSGPNSGEGGSLLELSQGGKVAFALANGEQRTFLQDGDCVILRGRCEAPGARRIGFGDCAGMVLPAVER